MTSFGPKLEGKIALITGAGSGVGKAMAELFSENGCKVVVVDVLEDRVNDVIAKIGSNARGMINTYRIRIKSKAWLMKPTDQWEK